MLLSNRFRVFRRSWHEPVVPVVFLVATLLLGCVLVAVAGAELRQAVGLAHRSLVVDGRTWVSPVPVASRALSDAQAAGGIWRPGLPVTNCRVFDDPLSPGTPLVDPTVYRDYPVAVAEPPVLACDGSNPVFLPSVAYDRAAWESAGGAAAEFVAPLPWCELSPTVSADIWLPAASRVLTCRGQQPVRVPAGGVGLVADRLLADLSERREVWSR